MRNVFRALCLFILAGSCTSPNETGDLKLWYDEPASKWVEALPVGNGRLGAMVFGVPGDELIQLNENTIWAGSPNNNDNPEALEALPAIRQMIFEGKYNEAQDLVNARVISKKSHGMPYQTAGNLRLKFDDHDDFTAFYRDLDIERAVATTTYKVGEVSYKREVFSSFSDGVIVIRLTADKPGSIAFKMSMDRPGDVTVKAEADNLLSMSGFTSGFEGVKGDTLAFVVLAKVINEGGELSSDEASVSLANSNSATILVSIGTGFVNYKDISGDAYAQAMEYLGKAEGRDFRAMQKDHTAFYQNLFNRVTLDLGRTDSVKNTTDVRIEQFRHGNDPSLAALYFQYGRYLLISSSQPGTQAANLQGIWADQLFPAWDSKYTININAEMNYWPAEPTNLPELHEPLIQMIRELAEAGSVTAKTMYGAGGWVAHHNTDIWRITGPVDGAYWGMWPMGGVWLSQHLFDKYEFSGDTEYLRSVYPVMKGAAEFCLDVLQEHPETGWLVVVPSNSPENSPADHYQSSMSAGTTMDNQLVADIMQKTLKAAEILGVDEPLKERMETALAKLPPMQIGKHGQLQEWMYDWDNPNDKHRHVSHLYGMFPSNQITPLSTPELADAARTTLIHRGDPSTGWSVNWKINLWARLLDGNHVYDLIKEQIKLVGRDNGQGRGFGEAGGTYANMFDAHPPFQIDGNFGFTSGLAEMLMQSHDGAIHLIPALPDVWPAGKVTGLRARGGFEIVELIWEDHKVVKAVIKSRHGGNLRIRSANQLTAKGKFAEAQGENPNPFYQRPAVKQPLISPEASLKAFDLPEYYLYDIETSQGETIILTAK